MSKIDDVLKKIDIAEYANKISSLDNNDPDFKNKKRDLVEECKERIINTIKDESIEIRVAILDYLFCLAPPLVVRMIESGNSNIIEAQLVLERIRGIDTLDIKKDLDSAKSIYTLYATFNNGILSNKSAMLTENGNRICDLLNKYLEEKSDEEINDMVNRNILDFYKNLYHVDKLIFMNRKNDSILPRSKFIEKLFSLDCIDDETKSNVYNDVFLKNPLLAGYDYSDIIEDNPNLIMIVKGLFKKCHADFFDVICSDVFENDDDYDEIIEILKTVVELNKNDENGLKQFFKEIASRKDRCPKLIKFLEKEEFYKKYGVQNLEEEYQIAVNKILNGHLNVDEYIIRNLGKSKVFIDNFDKILDLFAKSNDIEYQRNLILPLVIALTEIEKNKYGLDFIVDISSVKIDLNTLGEYSKKDNKMYINPFYIKNASNVKDILAISFQTVKHEVRHAKQFKELETSDVLNYDNLIMAIDAYYMDDIFYSYYKTNYQHISFERDARACAYADTMELLKDYPELTKNLEPESISKYILSDYIRKRESLGSTEYYGIISLFEEECNELLSFIKNEEDFKYYKDKIFKYPVIKQFYDYDEEKKEFKRKPDEYFERRLKELNDLPDSLAKREEVYSIKAFRYATKVGEYLRGKFNKLESGVYEGYSSGVIEEVTDNVGPRPSR